MAMTFAHALYRSASASGRVPEVAEALGVRSKPLQVAMQTESAFVDVLTLAYGTPVAGAVGSTTECLDARQRERVRERLEAAGLPTSIVKMSSIGQGWLPRDAIVLVEYDAGEGFGFIAYPSRPCGGAPSVEKDLGEAMMREWTATDDDDKCELMKGWLENGRAARRDLALRILEVDKSNKEAAERLGNLVALSDRMASDLEARKAENRALLKSVAEDRDVARKEADRVRKEVVSIVKNTVELNRQEGAMKKRLSSALTAKEDAERVLETTLAAAEDARKRADQAQRAADKAVKRAEERRVRADEAMRRADAVVAEAGRESAAAEQGAAAARRMAEDARMDARAAERARAEVVAACDAERSKVSAARDELENLQEKLRTARGNVEQARDQLDANAALLGGLRGALAGAAAEVNRETYAALARIDAFRAHVQMNLILARPSDRDHQSR